MNTPYQSAQMGSYFPFRSEEADRWTPIDPALTSGQQYYFHESNRKRGMDTNPAVYDQPTHPYATAHALQVPVTDVAPLDLGQWPVYDYSYRSQRYMSPHGPFGGTVSEASSASDTGLSPEATTYSMSFVTSPATATNTYFAPPMNMVGPWVPDNSHSYASSPPFSQPAYMPNQMSSLSMKEIEFTPRHDHQIDRFMEEDTETIHVEAQAKLHEPEELNFSEPNTSVTQSSARKSFSVSRASTQDFDGIGSLDDDEDNDSHLIPDNDSDSDYHQGSRPKRRTASGSGRGNNFAATNRNNRTPRQNKATSNRSTLIQTVNTKVRKSLSGNGRHNSTSKNKRPSFASGGTQSRQDRSFPCTFRKFGCDATFANKNEWKRHVSSQHLQLGFYRCDLGSCNPDNATSNGTGPHVSNTSVEIQVDENGEEHEFEVKTYNDFNRKDLFTQHCRRMHGPARNNPNIPNGGKATNERETAFEAELESIRQRCWRVRRKAPSRSSCGFCHRVFQTQEPQHAHGLDDDATDDGSAELKAWEDRMEHLGRHYEKDSVRLEDEDLDDDLVAWGLDTGVFAYVDVPGPDNQPVQIPWLQGFEAPGANDSSNDVTRNGTGARRGHRRQQPSRSIVSDRQQAMVRQIRAQQEQQQHRLLPLASSRQAPADEDDDEDADAEAEDE